MTPMQRMAVFAASGQVALQRCLACGTAQYPPRALCVACLAQTLEWSATESEEGEVLAATVLHHSHEATFREALPMRVGLVRLDAGPTVVCFLDAGCTGGTRVQITARTDTTRRAVLTAAPIAPAAQPRAAAAAPSR
jgi:uncharacterized OB-fold protein